MLGFPLSSSATGTSVTKPSISAASQTCFSVGKRFPICLMPSNSPSLICLDERREPSPAPLSSFELADRSADPLCDLPSDAPSRRQGAFVHRFSRRALQCGSGSRHRPVKHDGRLRPAKSNSRFRRQDAPDATEKGRYLSVDDRVHVRFQRHPVDELANTQVENRRVNTPHPLNFPNRDSKFVPLTPPDFRP